MLVLPLGITRRTAHVHREHVIFTGVTFYMLVMLGVGFYASRRRHTRRTGVHGCRAEDYPLWLSVRSPIIATWFGGSMMLGRRRRRIRRRHDGRHRGPLGRRARTVFDRRNVLRATVPSAEDHHRRRFHGSTATAGPPVWRSRSQRFFRTGNVGCLECLLRFGTIFQALTEHSGLETGILDRCVRHHPLHDGRRHVGRGHD